MLKIQTIFTKIRNLINNREDELLLEVDSKFQNTFFKENLIKDIEKLPYKFKKYLEKEKIVDKDWENDNKLDLIINDCLIIEDIIKVLKTINSNLKEFNQSKDSIIKFIPEIGDNKNNAFLKNIEAFGQIVIINTNKFSLKLKNVLQ